jgi:ABC-type multidrug transport system fused ATPase/permease subunit
VVKWHTATRGEGGVGRVGEVVIDGFALQNTQPQSLRSQLGVVSQEPTLFSGTIRDNFLYGK